MSIHCSQTWTVFQSPILMRNPDWSHLTIHVEECQTIVFESPLSLFSFLFKTLRRPNEQFIDPVFLIHTFPPFLYFATEKVPLFNFLMECRANNLGMDFIHVAKTLPISQKLSTLFFLFHEYVLWKERNPNWIDPWDILNRLTQFKKNNRPSRIHWVGESQQTTFNQLTLRALGAIARTHIHHNSVATHRNHKMSLAHLCKIMTRFKKQFYGFFWFFSPSTAIEAITFRLAFPQIQLWVSPAQNKYDDIFGFLRDQTQRYDAGHPTQAGTQNVVTEIVEDHVVPDTLSSSWYWNESVKSGIRRVPEALNAETQLWIDYLSEKTMPTDFFTLRAILVTRHVRWTPSVLELSFVEKDSGLNIRVSPECFLPSWRTQTIVSLPHQDRLR